MKNLYFDNTMIESTMIIALIDWCINKHKLIYTMKSH